MHYSDYLQLNKILGAQKPESSDAHDEMLFIVIHQAYELWFKQLLFELDSILEIMKKPAINDNSPELQTVVHRSSRMITILQLLVQQIDIMETMTPMDFLDFRDLLRPASGFQSVQFKVLEAKLGLEYGDRHGKSYYTSQLRPAEVEVIKENEKATSLLQLVNNWLERMPFFREPESSFWQHYRQIYSDGLAEAEMANLGYFDAVLGLEPPGISPLTPEMARKLSPAACRAALFIMLYRGYPVLQAPFSLLNNLLTIDEQMSTWRHRHMSMVHRTIGSRIGTGGSTGRDYLKGALDRHFIYSDIARLTSFLIERHRLPVLERDMERRLGFF